nr:hypothetical protein [Tanacetum cinerariifolium]
MLIPDAFLTEEIRATDDFKEYETMFMKVDVPMNQRQPFVSTQGMHMSTPKSHRTPTLTASPQGRKRKQSAGESSSPQKSLKIAIRQQKVVEGNKDDHDSEDRLEPESHKDNPEHVDDDDDKDAEKVDEEEGKVPDLVSQEFNAQAPKIIEELFKNYIQSNVIQVHPTTTTSTETISSANLQQLYFKMNRSLQDQANDPALWEVLKRGEKMKRHKASKSSKSAKGSLSKHSAKDSTTYVFKQQQQQEWDAWVEETVIDENEVIQEDETPELITEPQDVDKRVPTIFDYERMRATLHDALSNQCKNAEEFAYHLEQTTNFMENQIVWENSQEDIRRPAPKPLVFFGPQRNPNEPPRYLYNKDLFFLKYENTEEKYILSLYKIHAERFPEVDLEEKMNRWVRKEFKTFNEDAQLSIQHWKDS